jgi:predicted alpha/beta-fold hydrolase
MRGLADKGYAAGFNVIRLNQRNCGGTERLSAGLYHSGLSADVDRVLREVVDVDGIKNVVVAGYSLGGNLALKLAGDYGDSPPAALRGVGAVSPVMELDACVRALEKPQNFAYQWNFMRGLKGRMRRKAACFPGRFSLEPLGRLRTVREFDDVYTAPHFGFHGASDYYYRASAMRVIDRVRVPGLIITAEDDPFVPTVPFRDPSVTSNRYLRVIITEHGGHCAFLAEAINGNRGRDGYWAETTIIEFAQAVVGSGAGQTRGQAPVLRA